MFKHLTLWYIRRSNDYKHNYVHTLEEKECAFYSNQLDSNLKDIWMGQSEYSVESVHQIRTQNTSSVSFAIFASFDAVWCSIGGLTIAYVLSGLSRLWFCLCCKLIEDICRCKGKEIHQLPTCYILIIGNINICTWIVCGDLRQSPMKRRNWHKTKILGVKNIKLQAFVSGSNIMYTYCIYVHRTKYTIVIITV